MAEAKEIHAVFPVHEDLVGTEAFEAVLADLRDAAWASMSQLGTVVDGTLGEPEVHKPGEIDGLRLPLGEDENGVEIPNVFVLVRFKAMAVPHDPDNLCGPLER